MVLFPPPFYFVYYISHLLSYIQNNFSYELARPIMGTIFLVIFTRHAVAVMIFTRSRNAAKGDNSMYCMNPDPLFRSFGKGSATPDYVAI